MLPPTGLIDIGSPKCVRNRFGLFSNLKSFSKCRLAFCAKSKPVACARSAGRRVWWQGCYCLHVSRRTGALFMSSGTLECGWEGRGWGVIRVEVMMAKKHRNKVAIYGRNQKYDTAFLRFFTFLTTFLAPRRPRGATPCDHSSIFERAQRALDKYMVHPHDHGIPYRRTRTCT